MAKKIVLILSLVLILFSMSMVCAEEINSTDDTLQAQTVTVSGHSFDDIQKTIDKSSSNVIELNGTYTINKKPITIKKSVTIQGSKNGAVLDAKKAGNILEIEADKVTLKDLTFTNAKENAIYDLSFDVKQDLTIINCTFKNNNKGYAIEYLNYEDRGTLTITGSTFKNNPGGAVSFLGKQLKVSGCNFDSNCMQSDSGLGAALSISAKNADVSNSIFTNNYAYAGGAINIGSSNLRISNCNFTSNSAKKEGGAIYASGMMENVINENIPWTLTVFNSTFTSNKVNNNENAIYAMTYNVDISNSDFKSSQRVYLKLGELKDTNNNLTNKQLIKSVSATLKPKYKSIIYQDDYAVKVKTENILFLNIKVKVVIYNKSIKKTYYTHYVSEEFENAFFTVSKLPVGKYNVKIDLVSKFFKAKTVKTKLTIKKAKTTVKAAKVTAKYKKSKKFTVKIQDKKYQNPVKKVKIKIKVYTGKKYKTYNVKTNKKGVAKINTNKLRWGTHKVVITSKDKNYIINKKSSIRII